MRSNNKISRGSGGSGDKELSPHNFGDLQHFVPVIHKCSVLLVKLDTNSQLMITNLILNAV